jgi:hypothetical protein
MDSPQVYIPKSVTYKVKVNGVIYGTIHQKSGESLDSLKDRAKEKFDTKNVFLEKLR